MDVEAIEKAFHNHHGLAVKHGPVQIEERQRFAEPGWKTISRLGWAKRPPSVGDQAALLIVNRNPMRPCMYPRPAKKPTPKHSAVSEPILLSAR
jgi:hypothetical protein